jgi:hypothetical protein
LKLQILDSQGFKNDVTVSFSVLLTWGGAVSEWGESVFLPSPLPGLIAGLVPDSCDLCSLEFTGS